MGHKQLFFRSDARERILRGAAAICDGPSRSPSDHAGVLLLTDATMTDVPDTREESPAHEAA
jgi:hypothetical protein